MLYPIELGVQILVSQEHVCSRKGLDFWLARRCDTPLTG